MCNCVITQPQNTVLSLSLTGSPGLLLLVSFSFAAAQQRVWMLQRTYIMLLYLYGGLLWSLFTVPSAAGKICTRLLRNTCHGSQCRSSQIKTRSLTYSRSLLYFHTLFLLYFKHNFVFLKSAVLRLVGVTRLFGAQSARRQTFQTSALFVDTPRLLDGDIICLNRPVRCDDVTRATETHLLLHTVLRIVASAVLQNTIFMAIFEHPFAFVARHGCRQEIGLKVTQTKRKESEGDTWWYIWERYMCTELVNHD